MAKKKKTLNVLLEPNTLNLIPKKNMFRNYHKTNSLPKKRNRRIQKRVLKDKVGFIHLVKQLKLLKNKKASMEVSENKRLQDRIIKGLA